MKDVREVGQEHPKYRMLIRAVINRVGLDGIPEINKHGINIADGLTKYKDTIIFWRRNRELITSLADEIYKDEGYKSTIEMIMKFQCVSNHSQGDIGRAFYGAYKEEYIPIYNCLTWFAAEEVCLWFKDKD